MEESGTTTGAGPGLQHVCCDGAWRSVQHMKTARCFLP